MNCNGYDFRIVHRDMEIGITSDNGKYQLVEMSDATGQYLLYSIIQLKNFDDEYSCDFPKTVYVTNDFWYHSRFTVEYGWIEGSNDFYIISSDSGTHRYIFDNDTWIPEYC